LESDVSVSTFLQMWRRVDSTSTTLTCSGVGVRVKGLGGRG
jgi:hypothetical protein